MRVIGFIGSSNSGKTTLICALLPLLRTHFASIAVLKHSHHAAPSARGDTDRFLEAGAEQAVLAAERSAWLFERGTTRPISFDSGAPLQHVDRRFDLWIVEGFKQLREWPRIFVYRGGVPIIDATTADAVVSDVELDPGVPRFAPSQLDDIAAFIARITAP